MNYQYINHKWHVTLVNFCIWLIFLPRWISQVFSYNEELRPSLKPATKHVQCVCEKINWLLGRIRVFSNNTCSFGKSKEQVLSSNEISEHLKQLKSSLEQYFPKVQEALLKSHNFIHSQYVQTIQPFYCWMLEFHLNCLKLHLEYNFR